MSPPRTFVCPHCQDRAPAMEALVEFGVSPPVRGWNADVMPESSMTFMIVLICLLCGGRSIKEDTAEGFNGRMPTDREDGIMHGNRWFYHLIKFSSQPRWLNSARQDAENGLIYPWAPDLGARA